MTAEPNADRPMTPTAAVDVLKQATPMLRDMARDLRSPASVGSEPAIVAALKISALGTAAIEATEPIVLSLLDSLKKRAGRVQELRTKIEGLRTLSDDVITTPAEAGTAHRTANKLQVEHDSLAEVLIEAEAAAGAFADARDEFWAAYGVFSARYESAEASARMRATRAETASKVTERAADVAPKPTPAAARQPVPVQETQANWVAIVAIAIPVGFIFAPALVPLAYFGPKWFRKPKAARPPQTPRTDPPKHPSAPPRPAPPVAPASASEPHATKRDRALVGGFVVAVLVLAIALAFRSPSEPARKAVSMPRSQPVQPVVAPSPAPLMTSPAYPRTRRKARTEPSTAKPSRVETTTPGRLEVPDPATSDAPAPSSFGAFEREQQARREAAKLVREAP